MGALNNTLESCISRIGEKWTRIWVQNFRVVYLETEGADCEHDYFWVIFQSFLFTK